MIGRWIARCVVASSGAVVLASLVCMGVALSGASLEIALRF